MSQSKTALYKRNFWLLVLEGTFFMGAQGFFSSSTIIPVFINMMTGDKKLVGLTLTLGSFFTYFGRLFIGPLVPHIKNHARFSTIIMFLTRPFMLLPAMFIFAGQTKASVLALMVSYTILWFCDGMVVPSWSEVLANTVEEKRHGRLLGLQMLFGGFSGIGAGTIVNFFLSNPQLDGKMAFGWLFLIGGILLIISCGMMAFAKNAPHSYKTGKVDVLGYFKELPKHLVHEKDYSRMMAVQFLFLIAAMCIPFTILFAGEKLGLPQKYIAILIFVQSLGVPLGGWMWGQICDRLGAHNGIKLAGFNILLAAALPLLTLVLPSSFHLAVMCLVLFLSGVAGGVWSCYFVYTIQAVRPESRPACMVLSSIITLPASFASFIAGYISDTFGFTALFLICIVVTLGGMALAVRLRPVHAAREERRKKTKYSGVPEIN